jgi:MerR family transcriptional regulator, light-induced transcriptional regulator
VVEHIDVRIGELSRRVGVSVEALRAWERRYGVLAPSRSSAGYRLYGRDDQRRALRMKELIDRGHAAAEAADAVSVQELDAYPIPSSGRLVDERLELLEALVEFDTEQAHERLDAMVGSHSLDVVLRDGVIPVLREIGERWARARVSVAQEHFASELIGGWLRGLGRGWDAGLGPRAVLACPGGERHDLGLLCCAVALGRRGWRVTYLGADTPVHALGETVERLRPGLVVLSTVRPEPIVAIADDLAAIGAPVALGGEGPTPALALRAGARLLRDDPVTAARRLTANHAT